jgi:hypothetical protein
MEAIIMPMESSLADQVTRALLSHVTSVAVQREVKCLVLTIETAVPLTLS